MWLSGSATRVSSRHSSHRKAFRRSCARPLGTSSSNTAFAAVSDHSATISRRNCRANLFGQAHRGTSSDRTQQGAGNNAREATPRFLVTGRVPGVCIEQLEAVRTIGSEALGVASEDSLSSEVDSRFVASVDSHTSCHFSEEIVLDNILVNLSLLLRLTFFSGFVLQALVDSEKKDVLGWGGLSPSPSTCCRTM